MVSDSMWRFVSGCQVEVESDIQQLHRPEPALVTAMKTVKTIPAEILIPEAPLFQETVSHSAEVTMIFNTKNS